MSRSHHLQCRVALRGPAQVPLSHWLFRMHGAPEGWVPRDLPLRQIPPSQLREAHCRLNRQCDPSAILAKLEVASSITRPPARTRRCIMSPSSSRRSFSFAVSTGLRSEPAHPLPCNSTEGNGASREGESPRNLDTSVIERSSDGVRVTEASSYPLYGCNAAILQCGPVPPGTVCRLCRQHAPGARPAHLTDHGGRSPGPPGIAERRPTGLPSRPAVENERSGEPPRRGRDTPRGEVGSTRA